MSCFFASAICSSFASVISLPTVSANFAPSSTCDRFTSTTGRQPPISLSNNFIPRDFPEPGGPKTAIERGRLTTLRAAKSLSISRTSLNRWDSAPLGNFNSLPTSSTNLGSNTGASLRPDFVPVTYSIASENSSSFLGIRSIKKPPSIGYRGQIEARQVLLQKLLFDTFVENFVLIFQMVTATRNRTF
jgi:hypothetical protein